MDSTPDSTMKPTNRKSEAVNPAVVKSKREKFFDSYFRQNFSLPSDSIIYYITKNPSTSNLYEKFIQTCKYFFIKHPILVIPELSYFGDGKGKKFFKKFPSDSSKITAKLWITGHFYNQDGNNVNNKAVNQNILSSVIPKIYRCDGTSVIIRNCSIFCDNLSLLISATKEIFFINITVKDKNGLIVPFEKIVEIAVKAKRILIWSSIGSLNITSKTLKELLKIPHFLKLDRLIMHDLSEAFDLETFYCYMKKNKTTKFWLYFEDSISEAYKNRLKEIIDEIIVTETHDYSAPCFDFAGQDLEKYKKLQQIVA